MYSQSSEDSIYQSTFGIHQDVTMLTIFFTNNKTKKHIENVDSFIYGKPVQLKLQKQYIKVLYPQQYIEKQQLIKEHDKIRNQNPEKKEYE